MVSKEKFDEFKRTLFTDKEIKKYQKSTQKQKLVEMIICFIEVAMIIGIFVIALLRINVVAAIFLALWFGILVGSITFGITKTIKKKRIEKLRREKIPRLIEFLVGDQLNLFAMDEFLPKESFEASGFAGGYDFYKGEDLIDVDIPKDNGKRSGVCFKACDLRVTREQTDSDGHKSTVVVYCGAFCSVDFPFEFKCKLAINSSLKGVKKIKLEDVSFNKEFQVFTNNQVEALCILTPTMMQKIVELRKITKKLKISIFNNHLYIGFPDFNLFEFGEINRGLNEAIFDEIYEDVALLLAIVDEIKTNNKVFKI